MLYHQTCAVGRANRNIYACVVIWSSARKERLPVARVAGRSDLHQELQAHFTERIDAAEVLSSAGKVLQDQCHPVPAGVAAPVVLQGAARLLKQQNFINGMVGELGPGFSKPDWANPYLVKLSFVLISDPATTVINEERQDRSSCRQHCNASLLVENPSTIQMMQTAGVMFPLIPRQAVRALRTLVIN